MQRLSQIVPAAGILRSRVDPEIPVASLTQNSKTVTGGALYFAIAGTQADGHDFIAEALKAGAVAAVVEKPESFAAFPQTILVSSTRKALSEAASHFQGDPSEKLKLVGVTGTNGKTTSVYLLRNLWRALGETAGMIGTVENDVGGEVRAAKLTTPGPLELQGLFAEMVLRQVKYAAMEVSSIAIDQYRTAGTRFRVGLFTNFTQDHLDYHGSFENYFAAKLKFFTDYSLDVAILNIDDAQVRTVREVTGPLRFFTFSLLDPQADFFASDIQYLPQSTRAKLRTPVGEFNFSSILVGQHNLYNALGVLAAAHAVGADLKACVSAFQSLSGAPGRLERVMTGAEYPTVLVDYAHTDDALRNVLNAVRNLQKSSGRGRVITVFGCGGDRDRTKRPKMGNEACELSDLVVVTSDNPRTENPESIIDEIQTGMTRGVTQHRESDRRRAIEWALGQARAEDFVLIAGKGHETYQILGTQEFPFDDREVVRDYYARRSP